MLLVSGTFECDTGNVSSPNEPAADPDVKPYRSRLTVRSGILLSVLGLSALALLVAGYTAAALQERQVDARIQADLNAAAEEFKVLAEVGIDPRTGDPFSSPEELVRTAMERVIPARNEGVLGIVGGEIAYTSRLADIALEDDPELVASLGPMVTGDVITGATLTTDITEYRLIAVPVRTTAEGTLAPEADDAVPAHDSVAALVLGYDRTAEQADFGQVFTTYAWVAASALGVVAIVGWLVAGRLLLPVRVLARTASRIGRDNPQERIPVAGTDDMAHMAQSVNHMLDRIEEALETQRQLVGDVRHELRTPLTIVRGHLELMDVDNPQESAEVRDLALDEIARMSRVVNDLTTLASIDIPDFVTKADVRIGPLTDDVLDKAVMLGTRTWVIDERAEVQAQADRERLTQAWLQLAANAVKFSSEGSEIGLGSRVDGDELRLWVRDEGVGIHEDEQAQIFDRFARAGDRNTEGSGLGLTIVRAIAEGHGGSVAVSSIEGEGSTFTISIPLQADQRNPA